MGQLPGTGGRQDDKLNDGPADDSRVGSLRLVTEFSFSFLHEHPISINPTRIFGRKDRAHVLPAETPAPDGYHATGHSGP